MPRLQIQVSESLDARLKAYADEIGVPKNAMCAVMLHQYLEKQDENREYMIREGLFDEYVWLNRDKLNETLIRVIKENGFGVLIDRAFKESKGGSNGEEHQLQETAES